MMPELHIRAPGRSDEETDEMVHTGLALGKFRQCSIGYHEECSDLAGTECTCACHIIRGTRRRGEEPVP